MILKKYLNLLLLLSPEKQEYKVPFSIKNPKLWWTHNLGNPYLYNIDVELLNKGFQKTSFTKKLGIRSIELVTEKDSIGESFYFKLNGQTGLYERG